MKQYIDKFALVAEIERRKKEWRYGSSTEAKFKREECDDILSFLDTLETKDIDEVIKTAEDHAYFAGSENTREKLIDKAYKYISKHQCEYIDLDDFRKVMEE